MLFKFENIADHARVWVYQTNKRLSANEIAFIESTLNEQISNWAAHGAPLAGGFQILFDRFILIAADEMQNAASGCSIDASTIWLKSIGAHLNIDFFDRSIAYLTDNEINTIAIPKIKETIEASIITNETIVFNNLVATIKDFNTNWQIKAAESWLKKYFKTVTV
jgi:hypothetical protein